MHSLLLVAVLSVVAIGMNSDVCGSHADGCSIPLNLPFFYKGTFRSACDHHDICYGCVRPAAMCCLLCVSLRFATLTAFNAVSVLSLLLAASDDDNPPVYACRVHTIVSAGAAEP